jgi:hypothetical protein
MNLKELQEMKAVQRGIKITNIIVAVVTAGAALGTIYYFLRNNILKPNVKVISADFANDMAEVNINGSPVTLYGNSAVAAGADWGVQLASSIGADGRLFYNRIELVKKGLVYSVIYKSGDPLPVA